MDRVIYFDCFSGASGDMIIGSLLDLGLDFDLLKTELAKLGLPEYKLQARKLTKAGFSATKFEVMDLQDRAFDSLSEGPESGQQHHTHQQKHHDRATLHHSHNHNHDHSHNHSHNHAQDHNHNHSGQHGPRGLREIIQIIGHSGLPEEVKERSISIFRRLAAAEAKIHGAQPDEVHFHEVGAVDAIVDIVGAVIGLKLLQVDKVVISPLPLGKGLVKCQHGIIPVPAPATLELLTGIGTYGSDHNGETVTPTGAAILSTLAEGWGPMPKLRVLKTGYGAGSREFHLPNLLRAVLGTQYEEPFAALDCVEDAVIELEGNIDDMNPEFYQHIYEKLFAEGALDVFLLPILMKKNRPAHLIRVLCKEQALSSITATLFKESSTIGLRMSKKERLCLERALVPVETEYGVIEVKLALLGGQVVNRAPEYEQCRVKAEKYGVPLKRVYEAALIQACAISQESQR